ncbi:DUF6879 family protein [Saccharopolyspora gloriosae]|uniref:DUF6879 family protein n=1 Tax=Saccharopolyspora gloriosae TaxID=455344 RepID=UPI001FB6EF9F|nr:DUF6879 family protein [Saccharopolyspora gloriosae]
MSELTRLPPRDSGDRLTLDEYLADFNARFWNPRNTSAWKFERRQTFRQPESPSWNAFNEGNWDLSIQLLEERRPKLKDYFDRVSAHGFSVFRIRVVEDSLSPYLVWELNSLLIRQQCGASITVVNPDMLEKWERDGVLPEIFVIGPDTVYEVLYDSDGVAEGAIRYVDEPTARRWMIFMDALEGSGEPLDAFFNREVAGLRPTECEAPSA